MDVPDKKKLKFLNPFDIVISFDIYTLQKLTVINSYLKE